MLRSDGRKYVKTKSIDQQQNSRKTSGPGNLGHYCELLKEEQVKIRFKMHKIEEENKKNKTKE